MTLISVVAGYVDSNFGVSSLKLTAMTNYWTLWPPAGSVQSVFSMARYNDHFVWSESSSIPNLVPLAYHWRIWPIIDICDPRQVATVVFQSGTMHIRIVLYGHSYVDSKFGASSLKLTDITHSWPLWPPSSRYGCFSEWHHIRIVLYGHGLCRFQTWCL